MAESIFELVGDKVFGDDGRPVPATDAGELPGGDGCWTFTVVLENGANIDVFNEPDGECWCTLGVEVFIEDRVRRLGVAAVPVVTTLVRGDVIEVSTLGDEPDQRLLNLVLSWEKADVPSASVLWQLIDRWGRLPIRLVDPPLRRKP